MKIKANSQVKLNKRGIEFTTTEREYKQTGQNTQLRSEKEAQQLRGVVKKIDVNGVFCEVEWNDGTTCGVGTYYLEIA